MEMYTMGNFLKIKYKDKVGLIMKMEMFFREIFKKELRKEKDSLLILIKVKFMEYG
jgi:hypothetical protein